MELDFSGFEPEELPNEGIEDGIEENPNDGVDPNDVDPNDNIEPNDDEDTPPVIEDVDGEEPPPEPDAEEEEEEDDPNDIKFVYSNIAKLLNEEGLISDEDTNLDDIGSSDALVEAMRKEIKRNEFADLSDTQRKYLEAIRDGVPEDVFLKHEQVMQTYKDIDETSLASNPEMVKEIILVDLKSKGISDARALKLYEGLVADGEELEEAVTSLNGLKAQEEAQYQSQVAQVEKDRQAHEKAMAAHAKKVKDAVYNAKEIIKDIKLTETLKDRVYSTMTKPVAYSEDGQAVNKFTQTREKDPIGFDTKVYFLYELTKGFTDFSIFEKKAQSKAARQLERAVANSNVLNIGSVPNIKDFDESDMPVITELSND